MKVLEDTHSHFHEFQYPNTLNHMSPNECQEYSLLSAHMDGLKAELENRDNCFFGWCESAQEA